MDAPQRRGDDFCHRTKHHKSYSTPGIELLEPSLQKSHAGGGGPVKLSLLLLAERAGDSVEARFDFEEHPFIVIWEATQACDLACFIAVHVPISCATF
jgi:hypothetical protein